jgi:hypothetical protein
VPPTVRVYLETGAKRVFACSLDWPGWCRSGRDEAAALASLAEYAPRYSAVARLAGGRFPVRAAAGDIEVVERAAGSATTDFGAPGAVSTHDAEPVPAAEARRLAALVAAAWDMFDQVVAGAPARLRKGPRGGGRDRDAIVAHVAEAEAAYARKLGLRLPGDPVAGTAARREALEGVLGEASDGRPPVEKGWPARYAARRIAWHALDHAWEIEDRSS